MGVRASPGSGFGLSRMATGLPLPALQLVLFPRYIPLGYTSRLPSQKVAFQPADAAFRHPHRLGKRTSGDGIVQSAALQSGEALHRSSAIDFLNLHLAVLLRSRPIGPGALRTVMDHPLKARESE